MNVYVKNISIKIIHWVHFKAPLLYTPYVLFYSIMKGVSNETLFFFDVGVFIFYIHIFSI